MVGFGLRIFCSNLLAGILGLIVLTRVHRDAVGITVAMCAIVLCAAGFSYLLTRRHARFIRQCASVLRGVGDGDYGRRLWPQSGLAMEELAQSVNAMASGIESQVSALEAEKLRIETVLGGMREGIMVLGQDGRIVLVNKAFEEIFPQASGYAGRLPIEAVPCPELQSAAERVLNWQDDSRPAVVSMQIEPGQDRFFDVSMVRPIQRQAGLGAVLVFHDLSEFRLLDKVRRDFVANVSHELRTPLTSIKGYAETLLGEKKFREGQERRFLDVILKNANHMSKMVDELLSLARIENDRQPPGKDRVKPGESLRAAIRECATLAKERNVEISSLLPDDGLLVVTDAGQLTQVFRNLLENAIKYGPEGSTVTISHRPGNGDVTLCVEDMGPGVPEVDRQRVFERFYRVDRPRHKSAGGTGLGLAIAKHIVERHGGRIWVEQAQGRSSGAIFCFSLPEANNFVAADKD